jgi:hypothetical protein
MSAAAIVVGVAADATAGSKAAMRMGARIFLNIRTPK